MKRDSRYARNIDRIIQLLTESPRTHGELKALLHMSERSVTHYLSELRNGEPRRVYVSRYVPSDKGGKDRPVYALGNRKDALRPPRQTMAERSHVRRERFRKNPEIHDQYNARERARKRVITAVSKPNTWFSALMGA